VNPMNEWPAADLEWLDKCPTCGHDAVEVGYTDLDDSVFQCAPGVWTISVCRSCGVGFLNPRPTVCSIGRAYERYFTHDSETGSTQPVSSRWRTLARGVVNGYRNTTYGGEHGSSLAIGRLVVRFLPLLRESIDRAHYHLPVPFGSRRLLDVGCGSGEFLLRARASGWEVFGAEIDPVAATIGNQRGLDIFTGDLASLPDSYGCFDVITMNHVIEHVHDARSLTSSAYRRLRPGGLAYVETPNFNARSRQYFGRDWVGLDPPRHLIIFTETQLRRILMDAGFVEIQSLRSQVSYRAFREMSRSSRRRRLGVPATTPERLRDLAFAVSGVRKSSDEGEVITLLARKGQ